MIVATMAPRAAPAPRPGSPCRSRRPASDAETAMAATRWSVENDCGRLERALLRQRKSFALADDRRRPLFDQRKALRIRLRRHGCEVV